VRGKGAKEGANPAYAWLASFDRVRELNFCNFYFSGSLNII